MSTITWDASSLRFEDLIHPLSGGSSPDDELADLMARRVDRWPGIVIVRGSGLQHEPSPHAAFGAFCRTLGEFYPQHPDEPDVREVRDRGGRIASGATARYSDSRFGGSLHTDGAESARPVPRCFVLACLRPSEHGGALQLVSAQAVHDRLDARSPGLVETLHGSFHFDRRGERGADGSPTALKPVFWHDDGRLAVSYLRGYIERGHEHPGVAPLTADQIAALDAMDGCLADDRLIVSGLLQAGDIAIVNNLTTLHGRTTFRDSAGAPGRLLLRVWLR